MIKKLKDKTHTQLWSVDKFIHTSRPNLVPEPSQLVVNTQYLINVGKVCED